MPPQILTKDYTASDTLSLMKLAFLGTRGEIEARTPRHRMHTSLLVSHRRRSVMIDCGTDWLDRVDKIHPPAIILTHAHPDHAGGLRKGAPCPVYAPEETWSKLEGFPIGEKRVVAHRKLIRIQGITFEAFPVEHSINAPAVGYRITAGRVRIFYTPDLVFIHDRAEALIDVELYIGDGATVTRSFIRRRGVTLIGHSPIRTQLAWCEKEHVPRAIFTHCGSEIVAGDEKKLESIIQSMASQRGVMAQLAFDNMKIILR